LFAVQASLKRMVFVTTLTNVTTRRTTTVTRTMESVLTLPEVSLAHAKKVSLVMVLSVKSQPLLLPQLKLQPLLVDQVHLDPVNQFQTKMFSTTLNKLLAEP
jgi:hypothetical protein